MKSCFPSTNEAHRIYCHFVREKLQEGPTNLTHTSSKDQLVGVFTKCLSTPIHQHLLSELGFFGLQLEGAVINAHVPHTCVTPLPMAESSG